MNEIPLFPVTATEVGLIADHGLVIVRLPCLTHPMQATGQATLDRTYALTPVQARTLAEQIASRLALLESAALPRATGPTH